MKRSKGTYYKALALLVVFGMNTLVIFACSFSSLFHSFHHQRSASSTDHSRTHQHPHANHVHQHDDPGSQNHGSVPGPNDNCCAKYVVVIEKADKSISRTIVAPNLFPQVPFVATLISIFTPSPVETNKLFPENTRRRIPPTIQDLRIVIQSFQI
jgi:hypothetical protein